jgi:hypothetical protein
MGTWVMLVHLEQILGLLLGELRESFFTTGAAKLRQSKPGAVCGLIWEWTQLRRQWRGGKKRSWCPWIWNF